MFLIMGHAGFCPSAIVLLHRVPCYDYVVKHLPSPTRILKTLGPKPYSNHSGSPRLRDFRLDVKGLGLRKLEGFDCL